MQRVGGFRRKTRQKLRKNVRDKGKISITNYIKKLSEGDSVQLKAEPAVQKGMYFPRFHGKTGKVIKKQGTNYYVEVKDGNKKKLILIHPVHLKKWK
ncbi:MAG: 50S ribosomal protein L21e [Candidatus Woesearchaeota archaeon]